MIAKTRTVARPAKKRTPCVHIRWMTKCDMPEVCQIAADCFESPWTEENFLCILRQRNCIGYVAEQGEKVVGFMIYELYQEKLHILMFAVSPGVRHARRRIVAAMVAKLVSKLQLKPTPKMTSCRNRITMIVPAEEGGTIDFFLEQGFVVLYQVPGYYPHRKSGEDALFMRYILRGVKVSEDADWDVCPLRVDVLPMQPHHLNGAATIAKHIFGPRGWTEAGFQQCIAKPGCTGWVATALGYGQPESEVKRVVGFVICDSLADGTLQISNMAVAPLVHKRGVGEMLITHLRSQNPSRLVIDVSTSSDIALAFLQAQGYQITRE